MQKSGTVRSFITFEEFDEKAEKIEFIAITVAAVVSAVRVAIKLYSSVKEN
jgi:ASC-1-like (ASCH) protein